MSDSTVRVARSSGFTVVQNNAVRDPRLSLSATGLYVRLMSLPDNKPYSLKYIGKVAGCGRDALRRCFSELEAAGYLVREQTHAEHGKFGANAYALYDEPISPSTGFPSTVNPTTAEPTTAEPTTAEPTTAEPTTAEPTTAEPSPENPPANKITREINKPPVVPREVLNAFDAYAKGDLDLMAALAGFAEKRAASKNPINTPRSVTLLTNKLDKFSRGSNEIKIAMLDKAVEHNWASVYALNDRDLADLRGGTTAARDAPALTEEDMPL